MRIQTNKSGALWGDGRTTALVKACTIIVDCNEAFEGVAAQNEALLIEITHKDEIILWELYDDAPSLSLKLAWLVDDSLEHLKMPYEILNVFKVVGTSRFYCRIGRRRYKKAALQKEGSR